MNMKKRILTLCSALLLSATSSAWAAPKVIVGSADFPESQLLGTIYAGALEAQNIPVEKKLNIGSREVYIPALLDGSITLIPEYSGALLSYLDAKMRHTVVRTSPESWPLSCRRKLKCCRSPRLRISTFWP